MTKETKKKKSSNMQDKGSTNTPKINVKIKELNVVEFPSIETSHDVLIFTLNFSLDVLLALDDYYLQNWIVDLGANFHVTPHKEWFSTYAMMHGSVKLGDSHQLHLWCWGHKVMHVEWYQVCA